MCEGEKSEIVKAAEIIAEAIDRLAVSLEGGIDANREILAEEMGETREVLEKHLSCIAARTGE